MEQLKLSKRLQLIASFVSDNSNIIDVGCDHAHLSIYLAKNLNNVKVTASDINPYPLEIAKANIKKYHLENDINVCLKDGIYNLDKNIDTIIISGMGGILISQIINNKENLKNIKNIILSPNNDFPVVRKMLKKIGFKITKEKLITDNHKTYLVLKAERGINKFNNLFGSLKNNDLETIYYYTNILKTNTNILKKIPKKHLFKRTKLLIENKRIRRFLETK